MKNFSLSTLSLCLVSIFTLTLFNVVFAEQEKLLSYQIITGQKDCETVKKSYNNSVLPMTKIFYSINNKTVEIVYGGGEIYIQGFIKDKIIFFNDNDYTNIQKSIGDISNQKSFYKPFDQILFNTLSLLLAWPKSLPVYSWKKDNNYSISLKPKGLTNLSIKEYEIHTSKIRIINTLCLSDLKQYKIPKIYALDITGKKTIYSNITEKLKDKLNINNVQFSTLSTPISLCNKLDTRHAGTYYQMYLDTDGSFNYMVENFNDTVGGSNCFGRCGVGCYSMIFTNKYTQDCFNHDGCVKYSNSHTEWECNLMFQATTDDYLNAPNCPF